MSVTGGSRTRGAKVEWDPDGARGGDPPPEGRNAQGTGRGGLGKGGVWGEGRWRLVVTPTLVTLARHPGVASQKGLRGWKRVSLGNGVASHSGLPGVEHHCCCRTLEDPGKRRQKNPAPGSDGEGWGFRAFQIQGLGVGSWGVL